MVSDTNSQKLVSDARSPEVDHFDLIIIGGGINGAGIARDAAQRGLKVCLLEQADLCHGTTRWSSRLIHGGLRYLEHMELSLVRESLRERETLLRIAPHLVRPLQLMLPVYRSGRRGRWMIAAGMRLYDWLSRNKSLPPHEMLSAADVQSRFPGVNRVGLTGAALYYDAQVTFAERLVVENAVAAGQAGADIRTYSHVDRILTRNKRVTGVRYTNLRNDQSKDLLSRVVVNAAGPWVDRVLEGLDRDIRKYMGGTKGTHIVTRSFAGAPEIACYVEARSDGRPFFVLPWNGLLLIGTTDIRFSGNPGLVTADITELRYLIDETNHVFPGAELDESSVLYHYTGVRPLPRQERKKEGNITRRHMIRHHRRYAHGLYSVIGGKLTTYRHLAEEVVIRVCRHVQRHDGRRSRHIDSTGCRTARDPLPGAVLSEDELTRQLGRYERISVESQQHLRAVYGSRALEVAALVGFDRELADPVCSYTHTIGAEIIFAFRKEWATTLADVLLRRTMAGLSPDLGQSALPKAIAVARRTLGWTVARCDEEERRYMREIDRLRK
jgi:glycerol-3-phosphate dehydrogenase